MHKQEVVGIANFIREQLEEKVFDMIIEDLFESRLINRNRRRCFNISNSNKKPSIQ